MILSEHELANIIISLIWLLQLTEFSIWRGRSYEERWRKYLVQFMKTTPHIHKDIMIFCVLRHILQKVVDVFRYLPWIKLIHTDPVKILTLKECEIPLLQPNVPEVWIWFLIQVLLPDELWQPDSSSSPIVLANKDLCTSQTHRSPRETLTERMRWMHWRVESQRMFENMKIVHTAPLDSELVHPTNLGFWQTVFFQLFEDQ